MEMWRDGKKRRSERNERNEEVYENLVRWETVAEQHVGQE